MGQAFSLPGELVAYRSAQRWVEAIEPARMERTGTRLRQHGVYLITGDTGGIGLEIAEHLARTVQANRRVPRGRSIPSEENPGTARSPPTP